MDEETKIIPTVGRSVHFNSRGSKDGEFPPRVFAAIITRVYDDETVSVRSFSETGERSEIKITRGSNPGQWDWMPYQKGQAKKTEELEEKLGDQNDNVGEED